MDHFGFICRESSENGGFHFVCYVFQCTDEALVSERKEDANNIGPKILVLLHALYFAECLQIPLHSEIVIIQKKVINIAVCKGTFNLF